MDYRESSTQNTVETQKNQNMKATNKKYAPSTCTHEQLCSISRNNQDSGDFHIMTDSITVWLGEQKSGERATQHFEIPRSDFNRLIRWYQRPQTVVR